MSEPITPQEARSRKKDSLPPEVIDAFNACIAVHFDGRKSVVRQSEVVELIRYKMGLPDDRRIYGEQWLDVEEVFRKVGWTVIYDKPDFNAPAFEEATFTFRAER